MKAGNGGNGCIAFRRAFCNPHSGPSGGDGGNGAHVIFKGEESIYCLSYLNLLPFSGLRASTKNRQPTLLWLSFLVIKYYLFFLMPASSPFALRIPS